MKSFNNDFDTMSINQQLIDGLLNQPTNAEPIEATFSSGRTVEYTTNILPLLMSDDNVVEIVSLTTGEVYKSL